MYDWNRVDAKPWSGKRIAVVDETLRDGLQSPSAIDPPAAAKLAILHAMPGIGVDAVSVGLPAAGPRAVEGALALAKEIAKERLPMRATAAARTLEGDVNAIARVSQEAGIAIEVYAFVGSSPIRNLVESWTIPWLADKVRGAGEAARKANLPFCLVLEDSTRTKPEVLAELFKVAVDVGARRVCVCDTVGHADARGTTEVVTWARRTLDEMGAKGVELDWHGHNDRGLAIGNAIAAARAGIDGIHATAGGFGERTGNVSMAELVDVLAELRVRRRVSQPALAEYLRLARNSIDASVVARHAHHEEALAVVRLTVNGEPMTLSVRPSRTLLELLRYDLDLVGTKQGCDEGDCGACTVLVDGEPALSCITLALACEGKDVETVESLSAVPKLDPLLDAFDVHGAGQCGFCTSGMLMSAKGLLLKQAQPSRQEIARAISGNLCRCTGYGPIVDAVEMASRNVVDAPASPPLPGAEWQPAPLPPHASRKK